MPARLSNSNRMFVRAGLGYHAKEIRKSSAIILIMLEWHQS